MVDKKPISEISLRFKRDVNGYDVMEKERLMESTIAVTKKRVVGQVEFNDGWFAEIQTVGIEGVEKDIFLDTIQVHSEEMTLSEEQFRQEFRVGSMLGITTITELRRL